MVSPNWSILQPVDVGGAFEAGRQAGRARRVETETSNALSAYAQNPDDIAPINALARFNPQVAMQLRGQFDERAAAARRVTTNRSAASGDPAAMTELAGIDLDAWRALSTQQREQAATVNAAIGQAALSATTPEQWDFQVDQLARTYPQLAQYKGRFDLRDTALSQAGLMDEFIRMSEPRYQTVSEGGSVIATDQDGRNAGYVIGGPDGAPTYVPRAQRGAQNTQPAAQPDVEAAIAAGEEAERTKTITPAQADIIRRSMGPNGQAQFDTWMRTQGIQVTGGATANTTPQIDAIEAELRRRGAL